MSKLPMVTIAIPCFNEEADIATCMTSILNQDYPADRIEIIVADGGSTDGTRGILRRIAEDCSRVRVIDNPARIQAAGLNAILRESVGDVIVRMDAHCEYALDYVRNCVEVLDRAQADNVGGAQRIAAKTLFQRAFAAALESPMGCGCAPHRDAESEGPADTVFLGAFRRRVFERVGLFDAGAITNEDADLNQRILAQGGCIYVSRDIVVHYRPRASFSALAKQYFAYGAGRARTALKHRGLVTLRPMIPFFGMIGGACAVATMPIQPFTPAMFGLYAGVTLIEAIRVSRGAGLAVVPCVWAIFPVMHAAHGVGFAVGLARYLRSPDWQEAERLAPRPDAVDDAIYA